MAVTSVWPIRGRVDKVVWYARNPAKTTELEIPELQQMLNRVTLNWKKGKRTHVFIDEFHVVFENEFSATFFNSAWRQFRKRNAYPTAITQNVEYLLDSVQASTMLSNSEFIVMLNQAASDREKLSKLLNISNEQMSYVTNAEPGCGLIKYGDALVKTDGPTRIGQYAHNFSGWQYVAEYHTGYYADHYYVDRRTCGTCGYVATRETNTGCTKSACNYFQ